MLKEAKSMKGLIGKKSLWQKLGSLALAALVVGGMVFAGAAPALAAGDGAPPLQEREEERPSPRLELLYQRLTLAADVQAVPLDHADDLAELAGRWIDYLAGQGEDVSELQVALDVFEAAAEEARGHHAEAVAILDEHAGFDDQGQVTDREQAIDTLREAGQSLRDARRALTDGTIVLRRAFGDWRREHRPTGTELPAGTGL
jgi:hypothetical protein